ncbi:hypothetical protein QDX81_16035 [Pseudomonas sp. CW003PS]|nr:hypothetical protein QDX81_16035 [Pseudomonas sp. CW003PS]
MGRREEAEPVAGDEEGKARGIDKGGDCGARHSTPFLPKVKSCLANAFPFHKRVASQSTEAVDNSVNNLGESAARPDASGLADNLSIFSPTKKLHIFH